MHTRVNIEAERGRLQMTKGQMCAALGIPLKTYNRDIRGAMIPSPGLEALHQITGSSFDDLLGIQGSNSQ